MPRKEARGEPSAAAPAKKDRHFDCHLLGSLISACFSFPLWKASAIGQAGFDKNIAGGGGFFHRYIQSLKPPYRGVIPVLFGMTWARAFIFYGSERGRSWLEDRGYGRAVAISLPPLLTSTFVQCMNQPIVRGSITIQDPNSPYRNMAEAMRAVYKRQGPWGLWHGTSAGVMKTVPKYIAAVAVKEAMEWWLVPPPPDDRMAALLRSAKKAVAAGLAGAALTNPLDVLRNEMFKTDLGVRQVFNNLMKEEGPSFALRGMNKNLIAVSIPLMSTIFLTDWFIQIKVTQQARAKEAAAAAAAARTRGGGLGGVRTPSGLRRIGSDSAAGAG